MAGSDRIVGLDFMRCCAILPVIVYHAMVDVPALWVLALVGVEIFFVLSGFLIAQMIFERFNGLQRNSDFSDFIINRWLRTFPLYYIFFVIFSACRVDMPNSAWSFLFFVQNFTQGGKEIHDGFYSVSWSLANEEWFYLLFAVVLFIFRRSHVNRTIVVFFLATLVLALSGRTLRYLADPTLHFDDMFRRPTILRLDAFCYGILCYLGLYRTNLGIARFSRPMFQAGFAILAGSIFLCVSGNAYWDFWMRVPSLSVIPAAVALMLPAMVAVRWTWEPGRAALRFVSTRTYALYLSHLLVADIFVRSVAPITSENLLLLLGANLLVAHVIYCVIERPILRLRPQCSRQGVALAAA